MSNYKWQPPRPTDIGDLMTVRMGPGFVRRRLSDKLREGVSIKDFGAVADGDGEGGGTDNATAIQGAIDWMKAEGGGVVVIPFGIFRCDKALRMYSNVALIGMGLGLSRLDFTNASLQGDALGFENGTMIYAKGSLDVAITDMTSTLTRGDELIATSTDHGLETDDWIWIESQNHFVSDTSLGASEQLGAGGTVPAAEINRVRRADSTTQFRVVGGVHYDYDSGVNTEISKITPVENIRIEGITFLNESARTDAASTNRRIRFTWARHCHVIDCEFPKVFKQAVYLENCWDCTVARNHIDIVGSDNWDYTAVATDFQGIKLVNGCWNCWVRENTIHNPTQGVDVSYLEGASAWPSPCRNISIHANAIYGSTYASLTCHDTMESIAFTDNLIENAEQGIFVRSRYCRVQNNTIRGIGDGAGGDNATYGVWLGDEGWTVNCTISGNVITDFDQGILVAGSTGHNKRDVLVGHNQISRCDRAIVVSTGESTTVASGVVIAHNILSAIDSYGMHILGDNDAVLIQGNQMRGPMDGAGIRVAGSPRPIFINNVFYNLGAGIKPIELSSVTDWRSSGNVTYGTNGASDADAPNVVGSSGDTGGSGSAGIGGQYVELNINGTTYKVLHDGTV